MTGNSAGSHNCSPSLLVNSQLGAGCRCSQYQKKKKHIGKTLSCRLLPVHIPIHLVTYLKHYT